MNQALGVERIDGEMRDGKVDIEVNQEVKCGNDGEADGTKERNQW